MADEINHPPHYGGGDNPYEAIKVMEAVMTPEEFQGLCKGNVLKYVMRAGKKGGPEVAGADLKKARDYLDFALRALDSDRSVVADAKGISRRMSARQALEAMIPLVRGEGSADLQSLLEDIQAGRVRLHSEAKGVGADV